MVEEEGTRAKEWYVPRFGPRRFRLLVGMSFYPYSLMNASYVLIGSLLAPVVHIGRMFGLAVVYLLAVGVSAHSLDAASPNKPWGEFLTRRQLLLLAAIGLLPALTLGLYYAFSYAMLLIPVGVAELFFLLAYNLEYFGGRFHTDLWFAFSWGFLPIVAGFVLQTDAIAPAALAGGLFGFVTALVEIKASRPYKALRRDEKGGASPMATKLEAVLKGIVATVLATALSLLALSILH